ncbi:hypothetical protein [Sandaracinus amylolyticus]|uniref:Uncharacterized protein n=1 Tax=Sandaracinus amylolyticus TaxID=927083 RepID=A0A0F6YGE2_9BACT|nr:hypothetical protein [Sandaracinus amylolyticus]AKF04570.1 hypothetical protein DB32_001719 [Sandaracinus amylolyticus]
MSRVPFSTFVFRGKRFEDAAMPLEVLVELETYRELVLAVAMSLFRQENPDRVRLPKNFAESLRLVLGSQERGSTVPNVERVLRPRNEMLPGVESPLDLFDRAADIVRVAFEQAAHDSRPTVVSAALIPRMLAFGKTLRDDESVIIAPPGGREGPVVDRKLRRRLQQEVGGPYEEAVELVGRVRAADRDREGFRLRTLDGRAVHVVSTGPLFETALDSLAEESVVRVRGTGVYDPSGALLRVIGAADVTLAEEGDEGCSISIVEQISRLRELGDGWLDGEGKALDPTALDRAGGLLRALVEPDGLPTPYLYPKPECDLQAEWSLAGVEVAVVFDLVAWTAHCLLTSLDSDDFEELEIDLKQPGAELRLGRQLERWLRGER